MSLTLLQNLGLTPTEVTLYELLVKIGQVPISTLITETKIKKPTVYKALSSLQKKGLVTLSDVKKIQHASPVSPTKLLELAEKQYESMDRTREYVQSIIPALSSQYVQSVEQPIVTTYEGLEGLKRMYKDILETGAEGFSILQTEDMEKDLEDWLITYFSKQRAKKKMRLKVIVASGKAAKEFTRRDVPEYRYSAVVPFERFPIAHEVTIYGDKVAFLHYKKGERLVGSITKHPGFAQTMKVLFDLAWEKAQEYKDK